MRRLFVTFLFVTATGMGAGPVLAQSGEEYDPRRDELSAKYTAGPALIYDCRAGHWACVAPFNHRDCGWERGRDLERGRIQLGCLPGPTYETRAACLKGLPEIVGRGLEAPRGCLHPAHRSRLIGFQ